MTLLWRLSMISLDYLVSRFSGAMSLSTPSRPWLANVVVVAYGVDYWYGHRRGRDFMQGMLKSLLASKFDLAAVTFNVTVTVTFIVTVTVTVTLTFTIAFTVTVAFTVAVTVTVTVTAWLRPCSTSRTLRWQKHSKWLRHNPYHHRCQGLLHRRMREFWWLVAVPNQWSLFSVKFTVEHIFAMNRFDFNRWTQKTSPLHLFCGWQSRCIWCHYHCHGSCYMLSLTEATPSPTLTSSSPSLGQRLGWKPHNRSSRSSGLMWWYTKDQLAWWWPSYVAWLTYWAALVSCCVGILGFRPSNEKMRSDTINVLSLVICSFVVFVNSCLAGPLLWPPEFLIPGTKGFHRSATVAVAVAGCVQCWCYLPSHWGWLACVSLD